VEVTGAPVAIAYEFVHYFVGEYRIVRFVIHPWFLVACSIATVLALLAYYLAVPIEAVLSSWADAIAAKPVPRARRGTARSAE
jgi:hypothetical protein